MSEEGLRVQLLACKKQQMSQSKCGLDSSVDILHYGQSGASAEHSRRCWRAELEKHIKSLKFYLSKARGKKNVFGKNKHLLLSTESQRERTASGSLWNEFMQREAMNIGLLLLKTASKNSPFLLLLFVQL